MLIIDGSAKLAARRAEMVVYRAAFRKALALVPVGGAFPGCDDALDVADMIASDPATPKPIRIAWVDVIQFERLHPDVEAWGPILIGQLAPAADAGAVLDALWRLAMAIEAGRPHEARLGELLQTLI